MCRAGCRRPDRAGGRRLQPGAILYQLLTGRPPFRAATVAETLAQLEQEPISPRQVRPVDPSGPRACLPALPGEEAGGPVLVGRGPGDRPRTIPPRRRGPGREDGARPTPLCWARREPEFAGRLVAQSLILLLTQLNFVLHAAPKLRIHWGVSIVEGLWLASAIVLRHFARKEHASDRVRMAWMTIDVALLTAILGLLHAVNSSLVLGYALVIAASGLWNRIRVVGFTTAISMIGYGGLAFETWRKNRETDSNHYPNIILPALVVLGFLISQQVRRIRALSPVDIQAADDPA